MKLRPILFSTPMVQAILEGRKTQTRRIIKGQPFNALSDIICEVDDFRKGHWGAKFKYYGEDRYEITNMFKPLCQEGDTLWVRETWQHSDDLNDPYLYKQKLEEDDRPEYHKDLKWKPSIFMPKEACRIFLKVTDVRVERLHEITDAEAEKEGVETLSIRRLPLYRDYSVTPKKYSLFDPFRFISPRPSFQSLWESINGLESWDDNPYVWVYEFERIEKPEL